MTITTSFEICNRGLTRRAVATRLEDRPDYHGAHKMWKVQRFTRPTRKAEWQPSTSQFCLEACDARALAQSFCRSVDVQAMA